MLVYFACNGLQRGTPVPLGDEFEDRWNSIGWGGLSVAGIEPSKINEREFFVIVTGDVWRIRDTVVTNTLFDGASAVTCLSSSYGPPQKLLIGTETSSVFIYDFASGSTSEIVVPGLVSISHVSFSSLDNQTFYTGDGHLLLRTGDGGVNFDSIFHTNDDIVDIVDIYPLCVATNRNVFLSYDQGNTWDTSYTAASAVIKGFATDDVFHLYLGVDSTIFSYEPPGQWNQIFTVDAGNFTFTGIEQGLLIAVINNDYDLKIQKVSRTGQSIDLSMGIAYSYYDEVLALIAANQKEYLLFIGEPNYDDSGNSIVPDNLSYYYDTPLPP